MKVLVFGKNKGKALDKCEESYIKWLATHKAVLKPSNKPYADDAKQLLEKKEEKIVNTQTAKILDIMDSSLEICRVGSFLSRCFKLDPSIELEVKKNFRVGQTVKVSWDDEKIIKKVEAA